MKRILTIAIAVLITASCFAQVKRADRLYAKWDYCKAAHLYEKAAAKHPDQATYYKLGECYQKMHRYADATRAYDEVNKIGHYDNAAFYLDYGLMLKASGRYANAKDAFIMYNQMMPSDQRGQFYASSCDTIIKDQQYDLPIKVAGVSSLNSQSSDLCPVPYKDGIVFISSREANGFGSKIYKWDGEHYLHVFYAKKGNTDTSFSNVAPIQSSVVNEKYHNGPVCFSKNFDTIYINRVSKELKGEKKRTLNIERNKIYVAVYKNNIWVKDEPFQYNSDTFSVATPYLTNNGSRIYFSSDMPGGYGGVDLYYCDKTANGWSKPVNMGPNINTFGNEKFPTMDTAGNFYFSSDGYAGYGGMDICVSKNANGTFEKAAVLKAPFNSSGDDYGITFTKAGKIGYLSSNRNSATGSEDIYYFDIDKDSLPCHVSTDMYVVGYQCPPKHELAVLDTVHTDTVRHFALPPVQKQYSVTNDEAIRIHFDFDRSNIRARDAKILDSVALFMSKNPDLYASVNGYCDSRGSYSYNIVLSDKRSNAAVNYLASKGVSRKRMLPRGFGKTNFVNSCVEGVICTDMEQEQNRRVEILFGTTKTAIVATDK